MAANNTRFLGIPYDRRLAYRKADGAGFKTLECFQRQSSGKCYRVVPDLLIGALCNNENNAWSATRPELGVRLCPILETSVTLLVLSARDASCGKLHRTFV
eukprot:354149-Chlamydomonas_euryale.AAC.5